VGTPVGPDASRLGLLAGVNVVLHLLALAAAAVGMRTGSPLVSLEERLAYLAGSPLSWSLAWGVWLLCALALVAFLAEAGRQLPVREAGRTAPLFPAAVAAAGAAVDLFCDGVQLAVLPLLAAEGPAATAPFRAFERAAGFGGLVAANGLYSLAVLLLTLEVRRLPGSRSAVACGWGVFAGGMLLVAAGFRDDAWLAALATGPTILLFCAWVVLVAGVLGRRGAAAAAGDADPADRV
jgi:hypothetical protein